MTIMPVSRKRLLTLLIPITMTSRALEIFPAKTCRPCMPANRSHTLEMQREKIPRDDSDDEPLIGPDAKMCRLLKDKKLRFGAREDYLEVSWEK